MVHLYTFIVTTLEMEPYQVIQFYCGRGKRENFIKEGKAFSLSRTAYLQSLQSGYDSIDKEQTKTATEKEKPALTLPLQQLSLQKRKVDIQKLKVNYKIKSNRGK